MKRLCVLTATIVSLLIMGGALPTGDAVAHQKSVKDTNNSNYYMLRLHQAGKV
jgi:hypothetical protein